MAQRVLIVEDSAVNRKILSSMLTRHGYEVETAASGEEALSRVREYAPDLIVLDIMLPGMDGFTVCARLKADPEHADIPVIFISSLDSTEDKIGGFEAGGVDYITKPFQPGEVLARICTHLRLCSLQQRLEEQNRKLAEEKKRSEKLLLNVLPKRVARELIETCTCVPQLFDEVTVCFLDIIGFTTASTRLPPRVLIGELDDIFTGFDRICARFGCERLKTIGDAYLFACGVPEPEPRHAKQATRAALEMIGFLEARNQQADHPWQVRAGIHSGPVIGGVVGTDKYLYDIFGDTVNIAARMEELGSPMQVNVSGRTRDLLGNRFRFSPCRRLEVKGKGVLSTYLILADSDMDSLLPSSTTK